MFYKFDQNNSYGKFLKPAREVVIEADSEAEAIEIVQTIDGVYFKGSSDRDCPCCGPRWSSFCLEYSPEEFQQYLEDHRDYMAWLTPSVPYMIIRDRDGNIKTVDRVESAKTVDAPMPIPEEAMAQESTTPIESEISSV